MRDPYRLARFVEAQEPIYAQALEELRRGRKTSHWMWFVFPQVRGLGRTSTSDYYGIGSRDEAVAYLGHPILGERLRECTDTVNSHTCLSAREVFGSPDDLKFRSSMTLFHAASNGEERFARALEVFYGGQPDSRTLHRLGG